MRHNHYPGVVTRFLHDKEGLMSSDAQTLPFVIEAQEKRDLVFLTSFLKTHATQILEDVAAYGGVLLRGFDVHSAAAFEEAVLSIQGLKGIREAFMSEEGREHDGNLQYVLHTNTVYKTGGTLYLGGFHSENYYSPDVPAYICFFCQSPSKLGGETGLIHMQQVYAHLDPALKERLEKQTFFVEKWLVTAVAKRYHLSTDKVEAICKQFHLPIVGEGRKKLILLYKPSVFEHARTIRAMICNPLDLPYTAASPGCVACVEKTIESIGAELR